MNAAKEGEHREAAVGEMADKPSFSSNANCGCEE